MYVMCIDDDQVYTLTQGGLYKLVNESRKFTTVVADDGQARKYFKGRFALLPEDDDEELE